MEFGVEKVLSLCSRGEEGKPGFVVGVGDSLRGDATVDEPISDPIFSLLRGAERFNHFFGSPMLREIGRSRIGTDGERSPWELSKY